MTVLRQTGLKIVDTLGLPCSVERGHVFRDWKIDDADGHHVCVVVPRGGERPGSVEWLATRRFKPVYRVPARSERVT